MFALLFFSRKSKVTSNAIIGADGTYSAIRDVMVKKLNHEIEIKYIDHKYIFSLQELSNFYKLLR